MGSSTTHSVGGFEYYPLVLLVSRCIRVLLVFSFVGQYMYLSTTRWFHRSVGGFEYYLLVMLVNRWIRVLPVGFTGQ